MIIVVPVVTVTLPYATPAQVKNVTPMDLELVFVIIGVIGFATMG
jgi:hypothetical protein